MPQASPPLTEKNLTSIAAMVVAAPVLCCGGGLAVLTLMKHRAAALNARYAAWHLVPVPISPSDAGPDAVPGFLAGPHGAGFVFARNPAGWTEDAGFLSFFVGALVLVAGAVLVYGLVTRRPGLLFPALVPLALTAWMTGPTLRMVAKGYEVALDPARNALTVNGRPVAMLADLRGFAGYETRDARNRVSWFLDAELPDGSRVDVGGPDTPHNVIEAAPAMNAALSHLRRPAAPAQAAMAPVFGMSPAPK